MRNKLSYAAAATVFVTVVSPLAALAQAAPTAPRDRAAVTAAQAGFCDAIEKHGDDIEARFADLNGKLDNRRKDRSDVLNDRRDKRADALGDARDRQQKRLDAIVKALEERAETDAQKASVAKFKTDAQAALDKRHAAIDKANADFKTAVDKAVADRKTAVDKALDTFNASVKAAVDKAEADCAKENANEAAIRTAMRNAIEGAKTKLKTDLAAADKISAGVKTAAAAHHTAMQKAMTDFKTAMEAARKALKAAFPEDTSAGDRASVGTDKVTSPRDTTAGVPSGR